MATTRFVTDARDFARRVEADEVRERADELGGEATLQAERGFFFTGLWCATSRPPGAHLVDMLGTSRWRRKRLQRDCRGYLHRLVESNASRVANDFAERVLESRLALERELRDLLDRTMASAERALESARSARDGGAMSIASELERLDEAQSRIDHILGYGS